MTARTIDLGGAGWTLREALGETWRWYLDSPLPAQDEWRNNVADAASAARAAPGWFAASVPGSVITDLWRAGELADPYRGRRSRAAEWTGARSWVYRRTVTLPALADGERAVLELDGVDPSATVYWDGEPLGRLPGLYRRGRFPVAGGPGEHRLAVVVDPVPPSEPQVGRTERVRVHRPRLNEGWDFCPRFPHQGIWRPLRIVIGQRHLADVRVRATLAGADGRVTVAATVEPGGDGPVPCTVRVRDEGDRVVASVDADAGADGTLQAELVVSDPERWWPNGWGRPVLYRVEVVAGDAVWQGSVGFRTAVLTGNAGAPAGARGYTALVNGAVVPLVGWNWAPADAQYGALTAERVQHLVGLAARSGARILRVWGGGLVETEEFYDACDRAGLFVWQEFSQSSSGLQSAPATDAAFVAHLVAEAAAVVPPRTRHPSLLAWGGGNELDLDGVPLDEARSPALAALRDAVAEHDPGRAWLATSPTGPAFANRLDVIAAAPDDQHDVHGPWEHQGLREHHTLYNAGTSLAHTEFGVEGMANRRALHRLVDEADRWPADRTNPVYRHLGDWWNNAPLVQRSFGGRPADVESMRRASQLLQAHGLGYAVEADRRRFPRCSLVLPWQLAESYPNAWCTSCVDHSGDPKPAFHAVTRAFAPDRVTARVTTSVWAGEPELAVEGWVWSERGVAAGSRVTARLRSAGGEVLGEAVWPVPDPVREPRPLGTLTVDAHTAGPPAMVVWELVWDAADGTRIDDEVVLASTAADFSPLFDLAPAALDVRTVRDGAGTAVEVTHRGGPMAVGLELVDARPEGAGGWLLRDGDPRPLLPGQHRRLGVRAEHSDAPAVVRLEAWNLSEFLTIAVDEETSV